jgi:serine/threonine-protein kinase
VYLANDVSLDRDVAIKVFSQSDSPNDRERILKESKAHARLRHKNILTIFESGDVDGCPYYVMPYESGGSLADRLRNGPLPISAALATAIAVASALEAAHAKGIIHRDIKPSNVLLPGADFHDALLSDFGMLGELRVDTGMTMAGQIFGTPTYMAPEQVRGEAQSTATDVYGLGVLTYEMVYGKRPYEGKTAVLLLHKILTEEVQYPAEPSVDARVRAFIARCLSKDPSARPTTPLVELRKLEAPPQPPEVTVLSPQPRRPSPVAIPQKDALEPDVTAAPPPSGRVSRLVVVGIGCVVAVAVIGGALLLFGAGTPVAQVTTGIGLVAVGAMLGLGVNELLERHRVSLSDKASQLLAGTRDRDALTHSLAIEVDQIILRCRSMDQRFLGTSIAIMIEDLQHARDFEDRQRALTTAVEFLEKLMDRLSPWYIRYEKLVTAVVAMLGIVPGLVTLAEAFLK